MDKKDLVIADKEMLIDKLKSNISSAKREKIHANYRLQEIDKNISQWEEEIEKQEKELKQLIK